MDAFQIVDGKMTDCSPFVNHFLEHLPLDPLERTLVSVELEKLFGRWVEHSYEYLKEARWGRYDQSQVSKELSSSLEEAEPFFSGIWRSIYGRIFPELSEPNDQ